MHPHRCIFDGLHAFDFGTGTSPVMEGFTAITPATQYSRGRGYGLKDARIWRAFDALQPDPLYQDFICIEAGGLAVDVPNGRIACSSISTAPPDSGASTRPFASARSWPKAGRWCAKRWISTTFKAKYFRFWNVDDLPADNTFDKYQKTVFPRESGSTST